ncbi:MAG: hypothetical protein AAF356_13075 [Planctomycetota bacterium]
MNRSPPRLTALAALATAAAITNAQPESQPNAQPESATNTSIPADFLRGPNVDADTLRTLVRRSADGSFERVAGRPEIAAALLLSEDEGTRERLRALEHDRSERLRRMMLANLDTVLAAADARRTRSSERAAQLLTSLQRTFGTAEGLAGTRDPLTPAVRAILPENAHAEHRSMVNAYWRAWVDSAAAGRALTLQDRSQIERRLAHSLFRDELVRLYRRTMQGHDEWARTTAQELRLSTPELARLRRTLGDALLAAEDAGKPVDHAAILAAFAQAPEPAP